MSKRLVWHTKEIREVTELLLSCKNAREIENIFDRVLTPREINDIGRRYKVLRMVDEGKTFTEIIQETGMSSVTISRITTKCGYGLQKSSGLKTTRKKPTPKRSIKLRYKGVRVR